MSEPNPQPLAALLASHPEECAAVLCAIVMHGRDMVTPDDIASDLCVYGRCDPISHDLIVRIGVALGIARIVKVSVEGVGEIEAVHRMAIARMGAAAWLAARCGGVGRAAMTPLLEWDPDRGGARLRLRFTVDVADTGEWTVCNATGSARLAAGRSRGGVKGAKACAMRAAERLAAGAGAPAKGEQ